MMKQVAILLAVVAVAHAYGTWKGGLSVRFGVPLIDGDVFISLPRTLSEIKNARWVESKGPESLMAGLVLYNPSIDDRVIGVLLDDTGFVAGLQIALPEEDFLDAAYDMELQGFTNWTAEANSKGEEVNYWTIHQYFVSEEFLKTPASERLANRDEDRTLQDKAVWANGFNGNLIEMSRDADEIADTKTSGFTKQACIPAMGRHYYYNMTKTTECSGEYLLNWFPIVHSGELIASGFMTFGNLPVESIIKNYFERPPVSAVKLIVPDGPQCLYDLADKPGVLTMHIYYINSPLLINCFFQ